jgi:adenylate kinase family enzyme
VTRIFILGPPGSGKTVLGKRLAEGLEMSCYELDAVAWEGGFPGTERPLEERLNDIQHIAAQSRWVTEGIFLLWTDELLGAADYIIWLDIALYITFWRIVTRRLRRSLARQNPPTGLRQQLRFIGQVFSYYFGKKQIHTRAFTENHLRDFAHKLAHCCSPADVEACFNTIILREQAKKTEENFA